MDPSYGIWQQARKNRRGRWCNCIEECHSWCLRHRYPLRSWRAISRQFEFWPPIVSTVSVFANITTAIFYSARYPGRCIKEIAPESANNSPRDYALHKELDEGRVQYWIFTFKLRREVRKMDAGAIQESCNFDLREYPFSLHRTKLSKTTDLISYDICP